MTQVVTQCYGDLDRLLLVGQGLHGCSGATMWLCQGGEGRRGCMSSSFSLSQRRLHLHDGLRQFGGADLKISLGKQKAFPVLGIFLFCCILLSMRIFFETSK